jgi:phosphoribosylaminoimidazole carboxylase PurK protein
MQSGTIGIVGGGQLGQMLTETALVLGFKVMALDPTPNSPAAQAGATQIVKDYTPAAIKELADQVDYLTTEFEEGLEPEVLIALVKKGVNINPAPKTIATILDKFIQKTHLSRQGIAMGPFAQIDSAEDAYKLLIDYGGKMLIKTRRGGYDGYGNRVVRYKKEVDQALEDFNGRPVYAEAFVPFVKELAVIVVRNQAGEIAAYPVVETIQRNNICHEVLAPAKINASVRDKALEMARNVAGQFTGAGAFGVEMFLTKDSEVWLNEIAPRVHNSGHYTIEACQTSQFANHIRAISGLSLGSTTMKVPAAVMINILGERNGPAKPKGVAKAEADGHTKVHIYGKAQTKVGRKMGHLTSIGDTVEEARSRAEQARKLISI